MDNYSPIIVEGNRTAFTKNFTEYEHINSIDLSIPVVQNLIKKSGLSNIDQLIFGQVIQNIKAPNIAREIVIGSSLSINTDAFSLTRACTTSLQAATCAIESIRSGNAKTVIAGGVDSCSNIPIQINSQLGKIISKTATQKSIFKKIRSILSIKKSNIGLEFPAVKEYFTDTSMGETAELMAKMYQITRKEQDEFANRSHNLATKAKQAKELESQIINTYNYQKNEFTKIDNLIRENSQIANYNKLKPVFDRKYGSVTAANSCALTDGAAAILLAEKKYAKKNNLKELGSIKSYSHVAINVTEDMLMGPAYAITSALKKAKLSIQDIDLFEIHEAFSAQILANIKALNCNKFATEKLNQIEKIGELPIDKLNIQGGSIAYAHPFAATGARLITQLCYQLKKRGGGIGLAAACAAGGLGSAIIIKVDNV